MPDFKWKPIEALTDGDLAIDLAGMQPLYDSWRAGFLRLTESRPGGIQQYKERLRRRMSVETGVLERLYDLDRGTTEALVEQGFALDLVTHSSTDIEPSRLIDILHDHDAGVQLLVDCIAGNRKITKTVVHELQATFTKNQDTTTAVDQFGKRIEIALLRGEFKLLPNNPKRSDGSVHEYCPPIHVESEMDNLLGWLAEYSNEDPVLVSAWLHHRFSQIHPYQDGNGRVARALTTYVLLRSGLLPLVIDRGHRAEYLQSLEVADGGDLSVLVKLFARLEQREILEALSVDEGAERESLSSAVIESLAGRLYKRKAEENEELRDVNALAAHLRASARGGIEHALNELKDPVSVIAKPEIHVLDGGPDRGNAHWYKHQVIKSGRDAAKFVNFNEDHYFVKATIRVGCDRLVFVMSFHHVGREITGIMEGTAFAMLETFNDPEENEFSRHEFLDCTLEPFVFTHRTEVGQIEESFLRWLDAALAIAIREFGDRL